MREKKISFLFDSCSQSRFHTLLAFSITASILVAVFLVELLLPQPSAGCVPLSGLTRLAVLSSPPLGGARRNKQNAKKKIKVGVVVDVAGLGDKSFNDSVYRGLVEAQKRLKIIGDVAEPANKAEEEQHLRAFAQGGYDLVVGVGFSMHDAMDKVAHDFPEINFAIVDSVIALPNVASLTFKEHEGSFLVGVAAALVSKKKKFGFVGGMDIPLIRKFQVGYEEGIHYMLPTAEVVVQYTGADATAWNDPVKGREIALSIVAKGADVIFHAAGGTGAGVIKACKERGVLAIGVDSNQDGQEPGTVLTSMLKRCDIAVFNVVKMIKEGTFKGDHYQFGLKENGVGTTDFKFTKQLLPKGALEKLEEVKKKIVDEEIVVTDYMATH
jgi:basic membrane protein A and related proteins